MKQVDAAAMTLADLRSAFRLVSIDRESALDAGRHKVANRLFAHLATMEAEIRSRGQAGERAILELLSDSEPAVRVDAAVSALRFASQRAEAVLAAEAAGPPGLLRLTAEMTLHEWRAGRMPQE